MVFSGRPWAERPDGLRQQTRHLAVLAACCVVLAAVVTAGCGGRRDSDPTSASSPEPSGSAPTGGLFVDTERSGQSSSSPQVVRQRFVEIDEAQLLDHGAPVDTDKYVLNLFPDVSHVGVVTAVDRSGDSVMWSGTLAGVELGTFSIVYTSGVYMVHVASPLGIYEVKVAGEGVYRVEDIDQSKFPGGGG